VLELHCPDLSFERVKGRKKRPPNKSKEPIRARNVGILQCDSPDIRSD
jgi:hypothetical protein